jgi:hypothetical protein
MSPEHIRIAELSKEDKERRFSSTARRRGQSRSQFLAQLLEAERVRERTIRYLDKHVWTWQTMRPHGGDINDGKWLRNIEMISGEVLPRRGEI